MALVMSLPPNWDFTIRGIISIVKEGRDAIYASIRELKEYGYCEVVKCRDEKGKLLGNDYVFYEEPHTEPLESLIDKGSHPHTENPYMDNPCTENPDTDKPDTENPPQIKKEENKEKKILSKDTYDWSIVSDDMRAVVETWMQYKREKKQTYKPSGFKTFYKKLSELSGNDQTKAMAIIERSMANNWAGIFELKQYGTTQNNYRTNQGTKHPSDEELVSDAIDLVRELQGSGAGCGF